MQLSRFKKTNTDSKASYLILFPVIKDLIIQAVFLTLVWFGPFHDPVIVFFRHIYMLWGVGTNCGIRAMQRSSFIAKVIVESFMHI